MDVLRRRRHLLALLVLLLCVGGVGAAFWAQGYRAYVVHTGSMEPGYRPGDLVVDRPAEGHYRRGEIITFRHSDATTDVVTHRITAITPTGLIHTKGDANATADVWEIRPDQVRGTVSNRVAGGGYVVVFFQHPAGVAALATAVIAVALLWRLFFPDMPERAVAAVAPAKRSRPRPGPSPMPFRPQPAPALVT